MNPGTPGASSPPVAAVAPAGLALNARQAARLLELGRKARRAASGPELRFLLVNESHDLAPFRLAVLRQGDAITAVSGVVAPEANAPFTQWARRLTDHLAAKFERATLVRAADMAPEFAGEWKEWLPPHALWLPLPAGEGGLLVTREVGWAVEEVLIFSEWIEIWQHAWRQRCGPVRTRWFGSRAAGERSTDLRWRRAAWAIGAVALIVIGAWPVRLSILAPAELIPADAAVVRAPLEGVLAVIHVAPNQAVAAGDLLVTYDDASLRSRLDQAQQALLTAEAELRQASQQALNDQRSKAQLALLAGRQRQRQLERDLLVEQLQRAQLVAPRDGIVLLDDPSELVGRPVVVGERILRVADPRQAEIEAWVPIADAVPLAQGARVRLFLSADPLDPIDARLRYVAHDSTSRPDGSYAYRVRAALDQRTEHRIGLKGTARIEGERVPMAYWVFRRPLAAIRSFLGY